MVKTVHGLALVLITLATIAVFSSTLVAPGPPRMVIEPRTGMRLAVIPAGGFTMGSPANQPGRNPDEMERHITISHPFMLGQHEVTQAEWAIVMTTFPSHVASCSLCPVENVDFYDVNRFLSNLNSESTTLKFRLPSEAEWEYACRSGTADPSRIEPLVTAAAANIDSLPSHAGEDGEFGPPRRGSTRQVGSYPPNAWGLFDMHGNVWEWTNDWYGGYAAADTTDPHGPHAGTRRVIRGGSFYFDANSARCGLRYTHAPQDRGFSVGFRVAADPIERGQ